MPSPSQVSIVELSTSLPEYIFGPVCILINPHGLEKIQNKFRFSHKRYINVHYMYIFNAII